MSDKGLRVFENIYKGNYWQDPESRSGTGSNLAQTALIRQELPLLIGQYGIKTMLDIPCGDFFWMKEIKVELAQRLDQYIGGDIVEEIVMRNEQAHGGGKFRFTRVDITRDQLPAVDLIFCRDCLVHLPFADVKKALQNFKKSGAMYLLTTTFPGHPDNVDILTGYWRTLNLYKPPFNFPQPLTLINEGCTEDGGIYQDKSLGLWRLSDLPGSALGEAAGGWKQKLKRMLRKR